MSPANAMQLDLFAPEVPAAQPLADPKLQAEP